MDYYRGDKDACNFIELHVSLYFFVLEGCRWRRKVTFRNS
nr:MAG TPA: hypothetical protein [Caudoviricetes sp.]